MKIIITIATISALIAILSSGYKFWKKFISPKLTANKLKRFYHLVEEWFDEIDRSNVSNLSITVLNNKDAKIRSFIRDNGLEYHKISFSQSFRRSFLANCGIKKDLQDNHGIFERYARCPVDGLYVSAFWDSLVASFYEFKNKYDHNDPLTNFANIEMRIKLLKLYTGAKTS